MQVIHQRDNETTEEATEEETEEKETEEEETEEEETEDEYEHEMNEEEEERSDQVWAQFVQSLRGGKFRCLYGCNTFSYMGVSPITVITAPDYPVEDSQEATGMLSFLHVNMSMTCHTHGSNGHINLQILRSTPSGCTNRGIFGPSAT